ncbi:MAG: hypothetical protein A2Z20_02660 [Bdellovibrionales bacterium RBG_16_40_8]|nr:MAG: hypothetical protein A2Z20_02660 [Bdellovibrionales bacterium RBG_16_40_8]
MTEWFKTLSKTMLVTIVLTAGVLFIVLSDPPRTVCDSQIELFSEKTKGFLTITKMKYIERTKSRFNMLMDTCKTTNTVGGCYELFYSLKQMLKDVGTVSPACYSKLSGNSGFSEAIWKSLELMAQLAWGDKPPQATGLKVGWFDHADLNLMCELKSVAINIFTQSKWDSFVDGFFKSLPGVTELSREDAWQRMLFSVSCTGY